MDTNKWDVDRHKRLNKTRDSETVDWQRDEIHIFIRIIPLTKESRIANVVPLKKDFLKHFFP